jgi:HAD superfamily hydrolase (TIGR01509 family)
MIKAIFWDNDGVLVDTEKLYYKANKEIFSEIGINLTKELYRENYLVKSKGIRLIAAEKGLDENQINQLRKKRNFLYTKLLETEPIIIEGVADTLKFLHGKFLMGIVSSSLKEHFDIIHKNSNLLQYFDFTLTSEDFTEPKPSAAPYLKALEITGLRAEDCIAIEDSERGLKSALGANLKCYVIPTPLTTNCNFYGAANLLNNVREILDFLEPLY